MADQKEDDLPPSYSDVDCVPGSTASPSAPPPETEPAPGPLVYNPPNHVFEDIYEACVKYADKHCCYGKRFLHQMKLLDVMNKAVFYYKLESFGEKRESETKSAPYNGEPLDGSENGSPPDPWDIISLSPDLFEDCHVSSIIPHTDVVHECLECNGVGTIDCKSCNGRGRITCMKCNGTGRILDGYVVCKSCTGLGKKVCWSCLTMGTLVCTKCEGLKKIKYWKDMKVTWKNHVGEYFSDMGYLPVDRIRKAKGVELFKKKDLSIEPIKNAPDAAVNAASERMLESHQNSFPNEMIIRQRHVLRAVPLTRVTYQWKHEDGEFYVYDTDKKVYFENYPQKYCCCACS